MASCDLELGHEGPHCQDQGPTTIRWTRRPAPTFAGLLRLNKAFLKRMLDLPEAVELGRVEERHDKPDEVLVAVRTGDATVGLPVHRDGDLLSMVGASYEDCARCACPHCRTRSAFARFR